MIEKIELTNFKGFKHLRIDSLSRITLLGGDNSIGKTSILEAIFLFFDRSNPEMLLRQFVWRGINRTYLSVEQIFSPYFYDYDRDKDVVIVLTFSGKDEKLRLRFSEKMPERRVIFEKFGKRHTATGTEEKAIINGKIDIVYSRGGQQVESELIITEKGLKLRDGLVATKPETRPAVYLSPRIPAPPSEDAQRFGELERKGKLSGAIEYLKKFDSRIKSLGSIFYGDSATIHADVGMSQMIPLPQLGDGLVLAMSVYLAMSACKDGTLLIDEFGVGVHHAKLPTFWSAIHEAAGTFNTQIIATTHSYECMEAATKGLKQLSEPEFSYIRLDRDRDKDEVIPNVYTFPVLEAAIASGWEVR